MRLPEPKVDAEVLQEEPGQRARPKSGPDSRPEESPVGHGGVTTDDDSETKPSVHVGEKPHWKNNLCCHSNALCM